MSLLSGTALLSNSSIRIRVYEIYPGLECFRSDTGARIQLTKSQERIMLTLPLQERIILLIILMDWSHTSKHCSDILFQDICKVSVMKTHVRLTSLRTSL